jgi:hypothetical protein
MKASPNARKRALEPAGIHDRADAIAKIDAIAHAAATFPWKGRGGVTDQIVLVEAHCKRARIAGKLRYGLDVRTVAMEAGIGLGTVSRSHDRLSGMGWLRLAQGADRANSKSNIWHLMLPRSMRPKWNTPVFDGKPPGAVVEHPDLPQGGRGAMAPAGTLGAGASHDVWRTRRGLGKAAYRVWRILDPVVVKTCGDLGWLLDREQRTIERHLARLDRHGLALRDGIGWRRGDADLGAVAVGLGVAGEGERKRRQYEDDRVKHKAQMNWEKRQGFRP